MFVHRLPETAQLWIHRFNHALIAGVGVLAAWYGLKLCLLNRTLTTPGLEINLAWLYASSVVGGILIAVYGFAMMFSPLPQGETSALTGTHSCCSRPSPSSSSSLILLSMPIVFALGVAGIAGLWIGGYPMQQLSSASSPARRAGCCSRFLPSCSPAI